MMEIDLANERAGKDVFGLLAMACFLACFLMMAIAMKARAQECKEQQRERAGQGAEKSDKPVVIAVLSPTATGAAYLIESTGADICAPASLAQARKADLMLDDTARGVQRHDDAVDAKLRTEACLDAAGVAFAYRSAR